MGSPLVFILIAGGTSLALSVAIMAAMLRAGWPRAMVDLPNERSLHERPTPRIGGIAVNVSAWIATCLGLVLFGLPAHRPLLFTAIGTAAAALFFLSIVDDRRSLTVRSRLFVQIACAGIVTSLAVGSIPVPWGIPIGIGVALAIVWMTNAYNFMDGTNGLAAGMAVIGFSTYAVLAMRHSETGLAIITLALAGASLGFLRYNFGTARAFLGDCGSIPLGFFAGTLGLYGWSIGAWEWWTAAVVFLPFLADASFTLLARALRREKFWNAHREHAYQQLALMGWSHRRVASWAYLLMIICAALAVTMQDRSRTAQWLGLSALALTMLAGWLLVQRGDHTVREYHG